MLKHKVSFLKTLKLSKLNLTTWLTVKLKEIILKKFCVINIDKYSLDVKSKILMYSRNMIYLSEKIFKKKFTQIILL